MSRMGVSTQVSTNRENHGVVKTQEVEMRSFLSIPASTSQDTQHVFGSECPWPRPVRLSHYMPECKSNLCESTQPFLEATRTKEAHRSRPQPGT
ncbi:hypothetical protein FA13DRAFT_1723824 [Coprinellus micaceus]|uniref:Uncharacterized protein n=1 Tax=Coprinellus micaceus TaxID=71717 RepID=A0A4Y7U022_COPMI|nr:hypothetical protein FA13DRAFT_1723824 [Coprinellus micaceus]